VGNLNNLFDPGSIAVIGVNDDRLGTTGNIILRNLLQAKDRKIFPVNNCRKELLGLKCHATISNIPDHIDLAIIATPACEVPDLAEECGRAGVGGIVIISAGFEEMEMEGKLLEAQINATRKKYGMRILGPNCSGFVRPNVALNATSLKTNPPAGHIGFIAQNVAGNAILDWAIDAQVGFSMFASLGTMTDVDFGDLIDFLRDDDTTRSILIHMESVGNAKKFLSAARAFTMHKPIIILKPGRFAKRAHQARSFTGSMVSGDAVYDAAFKRVGVVRVKEVADLFDAGEVLDSQRLPRGPKLAIVTAAWGPGMMASDALIELGGELAELSSEMTQELNEILPPSWSKSNPIDILRDANTERYRKVVSACMRDPFVDGVLVIYVPQDTPIEVARTIIDISKTRWKPLITVWMGAGEVRVAKELAMQNDVPAYETPEEAVRAYVNMYKYKRNRELLYETPAEFPVHEARQKSRLKGLIQKAIGEGQSFLGKDESRALLETYGIHEMLPILTHQVEEAVKIAHRIGYPVSIRLISRDISLQGDVAGVTMGINSDAELKRSYSSMMSMAKKRAPASDVIEGISIQRSVQSADYELFLGATKDKDFGTVILFGMGGEIAELIGDFSIGLPPLNQILAKRLMEDTKAYKLIQGWRGKPPADLEGLEKTLVNFSNLIVDFPEIVEVDIRPLCIVNGKPYAFNVKIFLDTDCGAYEIPYPHLVITPYPIKYIVPWKMSDGVEVLLRPIRPEDEPLEQELLSTISEETLRTRFFSGFEVSHQRLVMFCNVDYDRHMAIVAEMKENERRKIIGVARLAVRPDHNSGEITVLVHDNFQRKGLGQKLMEMMIEIGRARGLNEIFGEVLTENKKTLKLCKKLGFATEWLGGVTKINLKLT